MKRELLTFTLGTESYGLDILKVQEIRGYEPPTRIANAPDFIKGVINLRGHIVPIVDLRLKLSVGEARYDGSTVVIILNVLGRVVGVVVDGVSDVITLPEDAVKPAPEFGAVLDTQYILGLATVEGQLLIITDIEKLMGAREMALVSDMAEGA
ncbi:Chemotaxis protein CheW [Usitatibacter rugosus]|uniref:Chemotaxis protein CheW n=1 Tax=Usitatibacter rugosus TaxID=2732067 RepID=A0A6M4GZH2_9PROT|nr:chemotaxis protein CheW [Usitatibacter rugosus]QJR10937.1 Chemotaxis protein CheW [Usitatibacter rugosus]